MQCTKKNPPTFFLWTFFLNGIQAKFNYKLIHIYKIIYKISIRKYFCHFHFESCGTNHHNLFHSMWIYVNHATIYCRLWQTVQCAQAPTDTVHQLILCTHFENMLFSVHQNFLFFFYYISFRRRGERQRKQTERKRYGKRIFAKNKIMRQTYRDNHALNEKKNRADRRPFYSLMFCTTGCWSFFDQHFPKDTCNRLQSHSSRSFHVCFYFSVRFFSLRTEDRIGDRNNRHIIESNNSIMKQLKIYFFFQFTLNRNSI